MTAGLPPLTLWRWLLAIAPIVVLVVLVARGRSSTAVNAGIAVLVAVLVAATAFGAGPEVLAVGVGKGIWTGIWILYVIWAALLLYHLARQVGLDRLGTAFSSILPRPVENVLIVAWVLPSFIQGVAGFGTPIAVAAPLLVSMGITPVLAVGLPLVGYHWSVTFGSMGSSFYMGALTARLDDAQTTAYGNDAALLLGVNVLVSGLLVCLMYGGRPALRHGIRMVLVVGGLMATTLAVAVQIEPAIGSLAAGAAGFVGIAILRIATQRQASPFAMEPARTGVVRLSEDRAISRADAPSPDRPRPSLVLLPYAYLLVLVLAVFVPVASRTWVKDHLLVGPSFGETVTAFGMTNPSTDVYTPIALLGHPGSYIVIAAVLGVISYKVAGLWPPGGSHRAVSGWLRQAARASLPVLALASVATVMVDTGMVRSIAVGVSDVTGRMFPGFSPLIGMLGSFTTGSTTSSNALFSALQRDIALLIDVRPSELLAAQTAGGNVGNSLAPVVILIGASAVHCVDRVSSILRTVIVPCTVLASVVVSLTLVLVFLH
jgi:lactate permease